MGSKRELENKDEFLITLMELKLGVLLEDLSDPLRILVSTCV